MNLVHATLAAATIVAAFQAHEGFVDIYAIEAAAVPSVQTAGKVGRTSVQPTSATAADPQRPRDATLLQGSVAVSARSPVVVSSLR